jgi:HTH-type transcriptional regulator/antitoxin HigA
MTIGIPSYADLLAEVRPRSIRSEHDAELAQKEIDRLLDLLTRTPAEEELLSLLGDLVSLWESAHVKLPSVPVGALIGALLEARGLPQRALAGPVFAHRSAVSEVIHGKRSLTYDQVRKLARFFDLSPAVFFPTSQEGD